MWHLATFLWASFAVSILHIFVSIQHKSMHCGFRTQFAVCQRGSTCYFVKDQLMYPSQIMFLVLFALTRVTWMAASIWFLVVSLQACISSDYIQYRQLYLHKHDQQMTQYWLCVSISYWSTNMAFVIGCITILLFLICIIYRQIITSYGYIEHTVHFTTSSF